MSEAYTTHALLGMFFLANYDHEHYYTGVVRAVLSPTAVLIQPDIMHEHKVHRGDEVVSLEELIQCCKHCGGKNWHFFESREALQSFIDWREAPDDPPVIKLVDKKKKS